MVDYSKKLRLTKEAADTLVKYIERLAGTTWIDVGKIHIPVRKALHLVDGPASGWGARIPFSVYKSVVEKIQRDNAKLQQKKLPEADAENAMFEDEVKSLQSEGVSVDEAIDTVSGVNNLGMLADGMIEGFLQMIENIIPAEAIPEELRNTAPTVREFMAQGINETPPEIDNFLNKLSPGWRYFKSKEQATAHLKVMNYAVEYAMSHTGEDPAKLWEAWTMYPTLKGIQLAAELHAKSVPPVSNTFASTSVSEYLDTQLGYWDEYVRRGAVLFSNVFAQSAVCCIIGAVVNLDDAREFVQKMRAVLQVVQGFNLNDMKAVTFSTDKLSQTAQQAIAGSIMSSLNENFQKQVNALRKLWIQFQESLGSDLECIPFQQLFDGLIGILADMKDRLAIRLRALIRWDDVHWKVEGDLQMRMMERGSFAVYMNLLDAVERILDLEAKCPVDGDAAERRAVDLIKKLRFEGNGFEGHIRGSPLPEGLDPDSPLANLDPVVTLHGLTVEPGIQGSNLPNQELEELFRQCRHGNFGDSSIFKTLPGIFRRR